MLSPFTPEPERLLSDFESLRALRGWEPTFLHSLRLRALRVFADTGFPTPRLESWRFTNVRRIAETEWSTPPAPGAVPEEAVAPWLIEPAHHLLLVDGQAAPDRETVQAPLPEGVTVVSLAEAVERWPSQVSHHLGRHAELDGRGFVALNTALHRDGAVLLIPPGTHLEQPVQLMFLASPGAAGTMCFPRVLVVVGEGARATVVESYVGHDGSYLVCPVTEIVLESGSTLDHYTVQRQAPESSHVAALHVHQSEDSRLRTHTVTLGGGLVRNELTVVLEGAGGEAAADGLYLTAASQHVDTYTTIRHAAPNCTSNQLFKGILDDHSRAVFTGRVVVEPGAQGTNAYQSNRNLLLSDHALAHSNPQLEIRADDVRCTHGSTVGRHDADALFYLRTRGLDREAAESLLTYAFASEVVGRLTLDAVHDLVEASIHERIDRGPRTGGSV